jgi:hypothetical protein
MWDKKSTGNDDSTWGCSQTVGRSFRLITQVFKDVYEAAERYMDLTEITMIALKTKPKVTNAATVNQSAS